MHCDSGQLNALADAELSAWAAAHVRQHLKTCPDCAAEYRAIQVLSAQARAWGDVTAPAELEARIAAALPTPERKRRITWRPVAAAVAAALFALMALFTPGQPGRPAPAFADVERAMGAVQSASWQSEFFWTRGRVRVSRQRTWVRRMPPAIAGYDVEFDERSLTDQRGYVDYSPKKNTYIKHPPEKDVSKDVADLLRRITDPIAGAGDIRPSAATHWTPWRREKVTLEGRPCWKFSREERRDSGAKRHAPPSQGLKQMSLWADVGTLRVARIEFHHTGSDDNGIKRAVFSDYQYNRTPPKGVFDWSPPPGAKEFKPGAAVRPRH